MERKQQIIMAATNYRLTNGEGVRGWEEAAFEAGAEWADAYPKSPWVSIKDTLPPTDVKVLICVRKVWPSNAVINPKGYSIELSQRIGYVPKTAKWCVDKYGFPNYGYKDFEVIAWMPIPELPKGGEE